MSKEILMRRLDVDVPPRCAMHECVKWSAKGYIHPARHCNFCEHWHKKLDSKTCSTCLGTEDLDNFVLKHDLEQESWVHIYIEKLGGI